MAKLNDKQIRFCEEYLTDMNATQAGIRAGYSEKTANRITSKLLSKVDIQAKLSELRAKVSDELKLDFKWVLQRFKDISDRCVQAEPVMIRGLDGTMVESGEYKFDSSGANKATEMIGKHLGMFNDKLDLTTKGESLNDSGIEKLTNDEKLALIKLKQKMKSGS